MHPTGYESRCSTLLEIRVRGEKNFLALIGEIYFLHDNYLMGIFTSYVVHKPRLDSINILTMLEDMLRMHFQCYILIVFLFDIKNLGNVIS